MALLAQSALQITRYQEWFIVMDNPLLNFFFQWVTWSMHLKNPYNTKGDLLYSSVSLPEPLYLFMKTLEAGCIGNAYFNFLNIFKWCLKKWPVGYLWEAEFESQKLIWKLKWYHVSEVPEFLCWDGSWRQGISRKCQASYSGSCRGEQPTDYLKHSRE